ncbi:hypothetical protein CEUSTIGMA_g8516.t1, partial [Chlamydomonas eustigma]
MFKQPSSHIDATLVMVVLAFVLGLLIGVTATYLPRIFMDMLRPVSLTYLEKTLHCNWISASLNAFSRLGVADILATTKSAGMPTDLLAIKLSADAASLYRLLRYLSTQQHPVIAFSSRTNVRLTSWDRHFISQHPGSARPSCLTWMLPFFSKCRLELYNCIKTGCPGYVLAFRTTSLPPDKTSPPTTTTTPTTLWEALHREDMSQGITNGCSILSPAGTTSIQIPCEAQLFDELMTCISQPLAPWIAWAYPWGKYRSVLDLGGGSGVLMKEILRRNKRIGGVLKK